MSVPIGELAARGGVSVDTVRYYEKAGVLPAPKRNLGGQRRYDESALDALAVVTALRGAGFSIEQIRAVVGVKEAGGPPEQRIASLHAQLDELEAAITEQSAALRKARKLIKDWRAELDSYDPAIHGCGRDS